MKNILLFPIIFAFIFSACSDFSGNEDAVEASLKPGPVAKEEKEKEEGEKRKNKRNRALTHSKFNAIYNA